MLRYYDMMSKIISAISAVLPAYYKEEAIERVIQEVADYLRLRFDLFAVAVVGDGTKDNMTGPWLWGVFTWDYDELVNLLLGSGRCGLCCVT